MKTAKIVKLQINEWDGQYGKMYSHIMELDNGENIKLNKKKDNSFKVGDTVNYEENGEGKWKEVKEEKNNSKGNYDPAAQNKGAMIGLAFKLAFEHLYDKTNYNETYNLAVRIYEDAMALYNGTENKSEGINDTTENDDLPF